MTERRQKLNSILIIDHDIKSAIRDYFEEESPLHVEIT